jgi:serine phosphatase RsbU (regulator of sigma subunit)
MNEKEQEIIDYIMREVVRRSDKQITEDTPLVSIRTIH